MPQLDETGVVVLFELNEYPKFSGCYYLLKCPITCSIYFGNKAKPVLSTVVLLLLNSVIVRL